MVTLLRRPRCKLLLLLLWPHQVTSCVLWLFSKESQGQGLRRGNFQLSLLKTCMHAKNGLGWKNVWCECGFVWSWSHMLRWRPVTYSLSSCLIPTDATWWQALWMTYKILEWRFSTSQEGARVCVSPLTLALAISSRSEHLSSGRNGLLMIKEWIMLRRVHLQDCSCRSGLQILRRE